MNIPKLSISKEDAIQTLELYRSGTYPSDIAKSIVERDAHIVDIRQVMQKIGCSEGENGDVPRLAIARADAIGVGFWTTEDEDGVEFCNFVPQLRDGLYHQELSMEFPKGYLEEADRLERDERIEARVPHIPSKIEAKLKPNDYVLWEAQWTSRKPKDPFILRRFGKTFLFSIEHQWDLTEIERLLLAHE